jgi:DNA-binding XRE family transcriptional regulator
MIVAPPFEISESLRALGDNIRVARVRRSLTQAELAQKCLVSRQTIAALEQGAQGTSVGTLFSVLWSLGLLSTAKGIADPTTDEHGMVLENASRKQRVRNPAPLDNDF